MYERATDVSLRVDKNSVRSNGIVDCKLDRVLSEQDVVSNETTWGITYVTFFFIRFRNCCGFA